jgi:cyclic pyranopterin phosphate synthase
MKTRLLRLSVTDRCTFRCRYCMPEGAVRESVALPLKELAGLAAWLVPRLGIERIRLTGGEPLLRSGIERLIECLAATTGVREVSLTTNGALLGRLAASLKAAGLERVNVSLDSMDAVRFAWLTRGGRLSETLSGIDAAIDAGLTPLKLNAVLQRSAWRDDVPLLLDYAAARGAELRLIELMRTGSGQAWADDEFVPVGEVRRWIGERAPMVSLVTQASDPARRWRVEWRSAALTVGWIAPRSLPFCADCERLRLDARGRLRRCLMDPLPFNLHAARRDRGDRSAWAEMSEYLAAKRAPGAMDSPISMSAIGG